MRAKRVQERPSYGRAKLHLPRQRLLHAAQCTSVRTRQLRARQTLRVTTYVCTIEGGERSASVLLWLGCRRPEQPALTSRRRGSSHVWLSSSMRLTVVLDRQVLHHDDMSSTLQSGVQDLRRRRRAKQDSWGAWENLSL